MAKCPLPTYTEAKMKCVSLGTREVRPSLSTYVIPAGFAFRFVGSSLLNKRFPQTFNIILKYLMSCGKKEEKHPFFPPSSASMWGNTLVMYRRITLICLLCFKDMFRASSTCLRPSPSFHGVRMKRLFTQVWWLHLDDGTPKKSAWEWDHRCLWCTYVYMEKDVALQV